MALKNKASQFGGVLGPNGIIDVAALTYAARRRWIHGQSGVFTQNSTVKTSLGPLGVGAILVAGWFSFVTFPVGGALSIKIVAYGAAGDAEIVLTDAIDAEVASGTAREGIAFVLASTNVALLAADTIEIHTIADNNTVSTAAVGGRVTLIWDPTEATSPNQ